MADKVTIAVEKQIHYGEQIPEEEGKNQVTHVENKAGGHEKTIDLA